MLVPRDSRWPRLALRVRHRLASCALDCRRNIFKINYLTLFWRRDNGQRPPALVLSNNPWRNGASPANNTERGCYTLGFQQIHLKCSTLLNSTANYMHDSLNVFSFLHNVADFHGVRSTVSIIVIVLHLHGFAHRPIIRSIFRVRIEVGSEQFVNVTAGQWLIQLLW